jgi:hypothetical protein
MCSQEEQREREGYNRRRIPMPLIWVGNKRIEVADGETPEWERTVKQPEPAEEPAEIDQIEEDE